MQVNHF